VRRSLLVLLVVVGLLTAAPAAVAAPPDDVHPEWGSTSAHDAKVKKGCRSYDYGYTLTPPEGDWSLETFLIGPGGKEYGSGYFLTGADPLTGQGAFRLCWRSTKGGTYTIRALLSVEDLGDHSAGWLPETSFTLRKPRR